MPKKKKSGGRKPIDPRQKMVLVGFYAKQQDIDDFGGKNKVREFAKQAFEAQVYDRITKNF